jgi:hypothetical protein
MPAEYRISPGRADEAGHHGRQLRWPPPRKVAIDTRYAGYRASQVPALAGLLLERIGAVPGVRSVSWTKSRLMQGSSASMGVPIPGLSEGAGMWDGVEVGPHFFETMGIEVVRGRTFTAADSQPTPSTCGIIPN